MRGEALSSLCAGSVGSTLAIASLDCSFHWPFLRLSFLPISCLLTSFFMEEGSKRVEGIPIDSVELKRLSFSIETIDRQWSSHAYIVSEDQPSIREEHGITTVKTTRLLPSDYTVPGHVYWQWPPRTTFMHKLRYQPVTRNPQISNHPPHPPPTLESAIVLDHSIPGATRSGTPHAQYGVDPQNWCSRR